MNHDEAAPLLGPYLDGELDLTTALKLEEHLAGCPECQARLAAEQEVVAFTRDHAPRHPAPPALRTRIRAQLRGQPAAPAARPWWRPAAGSWAWPTAFAAAGLAVLLIANLTSGVGPPPWARDAISDHVRSLQASHLMDVVSTDQHTVKPWFAGKVAFSPQVIDLTASGYPLVGGRLDFLDGHEVAAVIYQRRKHFINLYTWPAASQPIRDTSYQQDGYHLLGWAKSGMNYVAVSELGAQELRDFAQMIKEQTLDSRRGE